MGSVLEAAEAIGREVGPISLGQGQGPVAEALIEKVEKRRVVGGVTKLSPGLESFMARFEEICDKLAEPRVRGVPSCSHDAGGRLTEMLRAAAAHEVPAVCTTCPSPILSCMLEMA